MIRIALLAVVLAAGCSNKKPEERKLVGSAAPVPATPGSAAGSAGSAAGSAGSAAGSAGSAAVVRSTGFAPFDDAMAGTKPWVAADDKAGVVELFTNDDLSGKTRGRFTVEQKCGPDAATVVEAMGKQMAERVRQDRDAPTCKEANGVTSCVQPGIAEGDVALEIQYAKAGDAWRVIGVKTYGVGVKAEKEEARYAELLKEKCK